MSPRDHLGVDAGSAVTRVATKHSGTEPLLRTLTSGPGGRRHTLTLALSDAAREDGQRPSRICVAVPDSWLDGDVPGAAEHEAMRAAVEADHLRRRILWVGQMAAVAAFAASRPPPVADGQWLVCDVGWSGVRAGLFRISGHTVQAIRIARAPGGGADFDARVRTELDGDPLPSPGQWFAVAAGLRERAAVVLRNATADESFRKAPVFGRAGLTPNLTAGLLLDSFQTTAHGLATVITAALAGVVPAVALLAGGMAWFPPVAEIVAELAATAPTDMGAGGAVKGALTFASGEARLEATSCPEVSVPAHEIRAGRLVETRLRLPGPAADEEEASAAATLMLDTQSLVVDVAGCIRTVTVPGLSPGPYRISVRPGGAGRALIVLRPDYGQSQTVLIAPLDLE